MKGNLQSRMDKDRAKRIAWILAKKADGKTHQYIADALGITRQRVDQLVKGAAK